MDFIGRKLSQAFIDVLGEKNYLLNEDIEAELQKQILAAFIEFRCEKADIAGSLQGIPHEVQDVRKKVYHLYENTKQYVYDKYSTPELQLNTYISIFSFFNSKNESDSLNELVSHYDYQNIFEIQGSAKNSKEREKVICTDYKNIPFYFFPESLKLPLGLFTYNRRIWVHDPSGGIVGTLMQYEMEGGRVIMIFGRVVEEYYHPKDTRKQQFLVPGRFDPPYYLLHEYEFDIHSAATVFLCDSQYIAEELNIICKDTKRFLQGSYIATAAYAGKNTIKQIDFSGLHEKNVIYIPYANHKSFANAFKYGEYSLKAGAKSFNVLSAPILSVPLCADSNEIDKIYDPWELHVVQKSIILPNAEAQILHKIVNEAWDLPKFKKWYIDMGFMEESTELEEKKPSAEILDYALSRGGSVADAGDTIKLDVFTAHKEIGAFIAPIHAGKTQLAISYAIARCSGVPFLNFTAMPPIKVLYIASESTKSCLRTSIMRAIEALGVNTESVKANLMLRYLRDENHVQTLDITEHYLQNLIETDINTHQIKLVIFDSLIALNPKFQRDVDTAWEKVLKVCKNIHKTNLFIFDSFGVLKQNLDKEEGTTRDKIWKFVKNTGKIKPVLVDNLTALNAELQKNNASTWEKIRYFFQNMEKQHEIEILIIHHAKDKYDGVGAEAIGTLCQNVFIFEDPRKEAIQKNTQEEQSVFTPYLYRDGVLLKATVAKCKRYPHLMHSQFGVYLRYCKSDNISGGAWEKIEVNELSDIIDIPLENIQK